MCCLTNIALECFRLDLLDSLHRYRTALLRSVARLRIANSRRLGRDLLLRLLFVSSLLCWVLIEVLFRLQHAHVDVHVLLHLMSLLDIHDRLRLARVGLLRHVLSRVLTLAVIASHLAGFSRIGGCIEVVHDLIQRLSVVHSRCSAYAVLNQYRALTIGIRLYVVTHLNHCGFRVISLGHYETHSAHPGICFFTSIYNIT